MPDGAFKLRVRATETRSSAPSTDASTTSAPYRAMFTFAVRSRVHRLVQRGPAGTCPSAESLADGNAHRWDPPRA
jgi:hypothetical protein